MTLYHVTSKSRLKSILQEGLVVKNERRGSGFENEEGVYLFNSIDDAADGVCNWLADEFDDEEILILLQVNLPSVWEVEDDPELPLSASKSVKSIPPHYITVIKEDF